MSAENNNKENKIILYDIIWDLDPEDDGSDLPSRCEIKNPSQDLLDCIGYYDDALADWLSDNYGFCVESFMAEYI